MEDLTDKQLDVLKFIGQHIEMHGVPPTQRDISAGLNFGSSNTARDYLLVLERKKVIKRTDLGSRNMRLTDYGRDILRQDIEREQIAAGPREIIYGSKHDRRLTVERAHRSVGGGVIINLHTRRKIKTGEWSRWEADISPRGRIWLPSAAARQLANEILELCN